MKDMHAIRLTVNGRPHELVVEARRTLADLLRHDLGYTGTHLGCEHGICGACTVLLDGAPVRACLVFGVQADGAEVRTVEGLADGEQLSDLQQAFSDHHALQCGFCTPGFLMLVEAYLAQTTGTPLEEDEARELVAANLCRCTGYQGIVEAVLATARARQKPPLTAIGTRMPRQEDPRLLRGRGRFGDDINAPGQLHARIVRSPSACGQVRGSTSPRRGRRPASRPWSPPRTCPKIIVIPVRLAIAGTDLSAFLQPVLARDTVRYVGEPLAVVVGDDPYACEDAAELVDVDVADQPPVLDASEPSTGVTTGPADRRRAHPRLRRHRRSLRRRHARRPDRARHRPAQRRAARAALPAGRARSGPGRARHLRHDQGPGLEPRPAGRPARRGRDADPGARDRRGRRVRGARRVLPRGLPDPLARHENRPPGQVGRGPGRAPDGGEPLPAAVSPRRGRVRRRRPDPGPDRRHHPGQRRLLPHPRRSGPRAHRGHAPGPVPRPRLPGAGPGGADQQDPVRHLPGTRPVRGHGRARAPARRGRHPARHRPGRLARAEPADQGRDAARAPDQHPRHRPGPGHRRLPGPARGRGRGDRPPRLPRPGGRRAGQRPAAAASGWPCSWRRAASGRRRPPT